MNMSTEDKMLEELKEIRKLLTPPPPSPPPKGIKNEFLDFLSKYKVLGLAVAFIMGLYLGRVVQALVTAFIMPIIELVLPGINWEMITVGPFRIGLFVGELITFAIVAMVIFLIVKLTQRWGIE